MRERAAERAGTSPPNLTLSGNQTEELTTNTTVGSLTLNGDAFLEVGGAGPVTLTVEGDILVEGSAVLFLNRSTLAVNESYDVEWKIETLGTSQFAALGANLTTNGYQLGALYAGASNITVFGSLFVYPSGWIDSTLAQAATLLLVDSGYQSDVLFYDAAGAPSTSVFHAVDSIGFNVWLTFKNGTSGAISLPGRFSWQNWTFPGSASVSGIGYQVNVSDSYVYNFAVMLYQGSTVTLSNSPDVVLSINIDYGTVPLSGLSESHYGSYELVTTGFDLTLQNTTAVTWNIYPFGGGARITESQVGEIQVYSPDPTTVNDSNLTGHGGYYGSQAVGGLSIANSTIASEVVAYNGTLRLDNCTVDTSGANRVLATSGGRVYALDVRLGPLDEYQTLGTGSIAIASTVAVTVRDPRGVVAGAQVDLVSDADSSVFTETETPGSGTVTTALTALTLNATGATGVNYTLSGRHATEGGVEALPWPIYSISTTLNLTPYILSTDPANGSTGVAPAIAAIVIDFSVPMVALTTESLVQVVPQGSPAPSASPTWTPSWDRANETLTLSLAASLMPATTYAVSLSSAIPQADPPMESSFEFEFTTAAAVPPVPFVISVAPANGSIDASIEGSVTVEFDMAMNESTLNESFSVSPGDVPGTFVTTSTSIEWTPTSGLDYGTNYTLVLSTSAKSAQGVPLAHPFTSEFRTEPGGICTGCMAPAPPSGSGLLWLGVGVAGLVAIAVVALVLYRRRGAPPAGESAPADR